VVHFADLRNDDKDASCAVIVLWVVDKIVEVLLRDTKYNIK